MQQIFIDETEEFERDRNMLEYVASFMNPESVNKVKQMRAQREEHAFLSDEEYEKMLENKDFKNNSIIDDLIKQRKNDTNIQENNKEYDPYSYLPKNLNFLKDYK